MTVKELIEHLQEFDPDKEVVLQVIDHTDWEYNFKHPGFKLEEVFDEEFEEDQTYCVCSIQV